MLDTKIKKLAKELKPQLISWRRWLHQHPELSFQEWNTQKYLLELLSSWGLSPKVVAKTGLYVDLEGEKEKNDAFFALRADIDALPILEINEIDYISKNEGVMHACGHDAHSTCLLGAIWILKELKKDWSGTLRCIFQPGEEKLPGGASMILAEGILDNPKPKAIVGQHVDPFVPMGSIGVCDAAFMAAADEIYLSLKGQGGHAAAPQKAQDLITISAQLIMAFQQLISRQVSPLQPVVLSFGKIYSVGGATNILSDELRLEGTLRTFNAELRNTLHKKIDQICKGIALAFSIEYDLNIVKGYPPVFNHIEVNNQLRKTAQRYLGKEKVIELSPYMGSEDFGFYAQAMPAAFYRLGTQIPEGTGLHTATFNIDENALELGAGLFACLATDFLIAN